MKFSNARPAPLVNHDGADRLALVHQVEGGVDLVERHDVGDQRIDLDLALHIPVDDLRHVRAAPGAAEGGAAPDAAGDELERPRSDLLAGGGDADDDALAPAAVTAFERLAHGVDVADALEGEVGAAAGEVDDRLHDLVPAGLVRVDVVGHAEAARHLGLGRVEVDADDLVGPDHPRPLDDVEADAPQAEDGDIGAGPDFRGVDHGADAGRDAAANVADLLERSVRAHLGERDLRKNRVIGECRAAHVMEQGVAAGAARLGTMEAAGAVWHDAFSLRPPDPRGPGRAPRQAGF